MMRSLYSAISGLKNHQVKMDVIGNNIANVNTVGFKRSRVSFATELSQTLKGASSPSPTKGGTNAAQVGLGVRIGSIDQIMTQGSSQSTGKATDLMLQGNGFFVLNNNGQEVYTRAGGFGQDSDGTLIDPGSGAKVQGYSWGADDTTPVAWGEASEIRFKIGDVLATDGNMPIKPTSSTLNQSSGTYTAAAGSPTTLLVSGLKGVANVTIEGMTKVASNPTTGQFAFNPIDGTITFAKDYALPTSSDPNQLKLSYVGPATAVVDATNGNIVTVDYPPAPGAAVYNDASGTTPVKYTLSTSDTPGVMEYTVQPTENGKYQIVFGPKDNTPTATTATTSISYDFTNKPHTLTDFTIDQNGVITGVYSNGVDSVTHKIAQIAVASFANDAGLQNVGGNFYTTSNNSGMATIGAAGEDGRASIISNQVEMSNVDLSTEFTDMIVTQRGFQANSRVITVSDTLLEELINLKR